MTPPSGDPAETLTLILTHLLPSLLAAALSVRSFTGRWRLLHSTLSLLRSSLSSASSSPHWPDNPLFLSLLPPLLSSLRSLHSLSSRCLDPALPSGKLHLQSDLDIAASSLSLHLHDLDLLLRSGLLHHPQHNPHNALVLPIPSPSASRADISLFLRDLSARLQIGGLDLKQKALDSLLRLLSSDAPKLAPFVAQDCDLAPLLRLLDPSAHSLIRNQAATAISLLCTSSPPSRRAVFEEGGLGPLLRLLDTGPSATRERAAAAIEAITADSSNAWAVAAYGGIRVLIDACRSGGGSRALAAGALKNVAFSDDLRDAMVEEGGVPVLIDLLATGTGKAQKNAAICISSLAALGGEEVRVSIIQQRGLQRLLQLLREASEIEVIEDVLRAIQALSASPSARVVSSSLGLFIQLSDLINRGAPGIQLVSASLLCGLLPSEGIRRLIGGCMGALVRMLECSKPETAQEAAAGALVMLLEVRANRKELGRDEKSLMRLVRMLDPAREEEVCKKYPVSVVVALLGGGGGCRKRMVEAEAEVYLQKLADAGVPGAKKAAQLMAGRGRLKRLFGISWRQ